MQVIDTKRATALLNAVKKISPDTINFTMGESEYDVTFFGRMADGAGSYHVGITTSPEATYALKNTPVVIEKALKSVGNKANGYRAEAELQNSHLLLLTDTAGKSQTYLNVEPCQYEPYENPDSDAHAVVDTVSFGRMLYAASKCIAKDSNRRKLSMVFVDILPDGKVWVTAGSGHAMHKSTIDSAETTVGKRTTLAIPGEVAGGVGAMFNALCAYDKDYYGESKMYIYGTNHGTVTMTAADIEVSVPVDKEVSIVPMLDKFAKTYNATFTVENVDMTSFVHTIDTMKNLTTPEWGVQNPLELVFDTYVHPMAYPNGDRNRPFPLAMAAVPDEPFVFWVDAKLFSDTISGVPFGSSATFSFSGSDGAMHIDVRPAEGQEAYSLFVMPLLIGQNKDADAERVKGI